MNQENYEGLCELASRFKPEELPTVLLTIYFTRNGCGYRWGIPARNVHKLKDLREPFDEDELIAVEGKLLDILILKPRSIDFKQKTGIQTLEVTIRSSETDSKQLLHKLSSELRGYTPDISRASIPRTKEDNDD